MEPPAPNLSVPPNLDLFKQQLLYYRCTRYDVDVGIVISEARAWIAQRAPQVQKPAIVLDIDETALSNWQRILKNDYGYISDGPCEIDTPGVACGDSEWKALAIAPAIEPTLELYKYARCIDKLPSSNKCTSIDVFFVTNRENSDIVRNNMTPTQWTLKNLRNAGYKDLADDHLYMRPMPFPYPGQNHKIKARIDIEKRGFTIIANISDQYSDLVGDNAGLHAERVFKLPNPFY